MSMRVRAVRSALLTALLVTAAASPAAARTAAPAPARHVVVVGLSGLRWSDVSPAATPALWRLAGRGSVGSLVDYAVLPLTCPADGWLTLNGGARAQSDHTDAGCGTFPAVERHGTGATVPALPGLIRYNRRFHNDPSWGLLARAPGCATAVGPGAALALATSSGRVASYLPAPADLTAGVLSRCPLTVIDLGYPERASALAAADTELHRLVAELPPATTLLITAPGSAVKPPHLQLTIVAGPGYQAGLLESSSTRQPGLAVLTDLTPTVLGWLGGLPSNLVGAQLTRGARGPLGAAIRSLTARDTAEQVWLSTHDRFFWAYALADVVALTVIALACWGAAPQRRRRRAQGWRAAGTFAVAVPVATFLANLAPWSQAAHPALALYALAAGLAALIGLVALLGPWRRDPFGPFGVICLLTLLVLGTDVITGSRLQLEAPFGLSVLEGGRFYGIGNEALGIYGITALFAAAWLATLPRRRSAASWPAPLLATLPRRRSAARWPAPSLASLPRRRSAARWPALPQPPWPAAAAAAVAVFAVGASGWPGFGGKVGGTIAMVPCFALLLAVVAGVRLSWRRVLLIAVSGLALFAVFALISYFTPVTGRSDIGAFAGNLLHGHAGSVLLRKIGSNLGSLSVSMFSPLVPIVVPVIGLMLWRPDWFGLKTMPAAYAADPRLRPVLGVLWLMPVLGWFADDSGVIVPAAALPLALPLGLGLLSAAAYRYRSSQVSKQEGIRAVPAIADSRRPVPAHDLAAEGDRGGEHPGHRRRDPGV
jgi:hypothetical protein